VGNAGLGLATLTTDAAGTTFLNTALVRTSGLQSYGDGVVLQKSTALVSGGGVTFEQTVDGSFDLVVTTGGATTFNGLVGNAGLGLATLTTDAAGTTFLNTALVRTSGLQSYGDGVVLEQSTALVSGGGVTFGQTVDGSFDLVVTTGGATTFNGLVGNAGLGLATLTTDAAGTTFLNVAPAPGFNLDGTLASGTPSVQTSGAQTYGDAVELRQDTALLSGGAVTFGNTVNGSFRLLVNTAADTTFNGSVGNTTTLTGLRTDGGGTTILGNDAHTAITINGKAGADSGPVRFMDAVTLLSDVSIGSEATTGIVTFASTINGGYGLEVSTSGDTTFNGLVGNTAPLASLATDGNGLMTGTTIFNVTPTAMFNVNGTLASGTPSVQTSGAQTYSDIVQLGQDTALLSTNLDGNVTFGNTVNGAHRLLVSSAAVTTFNGLVGNTAALTSLATDGGGTTILNVMPAPVFNLDGTLASGTPSVQTSGAQTYGDAVELSQNTALLSGGAVTFGSTLNGSFLLLVSTAANTTFNGSVGNTATLKGLRIDGGGMTILGNDGHTPITINGKVDPASGPVNFVGAVTLLSDVIIGNEATKASVTFGSTLDATDAFKPNDPTLPGEGLTVRTQGTTIFGDNVGSGVALKHLAVGIARLPDDMFLDPNERTEIHGNINAGANGISTNRLAPSPKEGLANFTDFKSVLFNNPVQIAQDVQIGQWIAGDSSVTPKVKDTYSSGEVQFFSNVSALDTAPKAQLVIATSGDVTLAGLSTVKDRSGGGGRGNATKEEALGVKLDSLFVFQPKWDQSGETLIQPLIRVGYGAPRLLETTHDQYYGGVLSVGSTITLRSKSGSISIRDQVTGAILEKAETNAVAAATDTAEANDGKVVNNGNLTIEAPKGLQPGRSNSQDVTIGGWVGGLTVSFKDPSKFVRTVSQTKPGLTNLNIEAGNDIFVQDIAVRRELTLQANGTLYLVGDTYRGGTVSFNGTERAQFQLSPTIIHLDPRNVQAQNLLPGLKPAEGAGTTADLTIKAATSFATGRLQSLYVDAGSLTISAPSVTVGDVAAAKNITIEGAGSVTLLSRPATGLLNAFGFIDKGVALIAGGTVTLPSGIEITLDEQFGPGIIISNAGVRQFNQNKPNPSLPLAENFPVEIELLTTTPIFVAPTDASTLLNEPPPIFGPSRDDESEFDRAGGLSPGLKNKLAQLGIYARSVLPEETAELRGRGNTIYRQPVEGKPVMENLEYEVVVNRVTLQEVLRIAGIYEEIVGENLEQLGPVTEVLNRAAQKYSFNAGGNDAMAFGNWLDVAAGGDTDAGTGLEILKRLKRIYVEVETLGLTAKEVEISKDAIAAKFAPPAFTAEDFKNLIKSMQAAPLKNRALEIAANPTPMPEAPAGGLPQPGLQLQMPAFDSGVGLPPLPAELPPASDGAAPAIILPKTDVPLPADGAGKPAAPADPAAGASDKIPAPAGDAAMPDVPKPPASGADPKKQPDGNQNSSPDAPKKDGSSKGPDAPAQGAGDGAGKLQVPAEGVQLTTPVNPAGVDPGSAKSPDAKAAGQDGKTPIGQTNLPKPGVFNFRG
jgi:hypothetical protein